MQSHQTFPPIDESHDPTRGSWVDTAASGDFPIQNLPFGRFVRPRSSDAVLGIRIGDFVVDLDRVREGGLLGSVSSDALRTCGRGDMAALMGLPPETLTSLRVEISGLLTRGVAHQASMAECLVPLSGVTLLLPMRPGNFSDFFASIHHARNAGEMRRPGNPLLPNFQYIPVAYHGRASTINLGDAGVIRPRGQFLRGSEEAPIVAPSERLDFECELGVWLGQGNRLGQPIELADAPRHVFGVTLLNDWSARDLQFWETQPLGPFLSKSFMTTVSPWVVTMQALAPFRSAAPAREAGAPPLLDYLDDAGDRRQGGIEIDLQVGLQTEAMRRDGLTPAVLSRPRFRDHYWTIFQMLAHQTSNGCQVFEGDVLGTGTISGPSRTELGCLLEMNRGGRELIGLPNGESRTWLADGDELILSGHCGAPGFVSIGLGETRSRVLPHMTASGDARPR